jgi:NADPH2:quinone reductase
MNANRAVVVNPEAPGRLVIEGMAMPSPLPNEAVVGVRAISLNRGEVRYSMTAPAGRRPGWDLAGIVEQVAADGSGPKLGARVVGLVYQAAWAEHVPVPTNQLAEIPDNVSFAQAATLPVAGLTALHALYKGGCLLAETVLITGPTGGTGDFACQLAKLAGARVVATVRVPEREAFARNAGADEVLIGGDPTAAGVFGPYHLIIDSVGGPHFGKVAAMLASNGTLVIFGTTAGTDVTFSASKFYSTGNTTFCGMILFKEIQKTESAAIGLKKLASLMSASKLHPHIDIEESWLKIAEIAQKLTDRQFIGKAVLHVDK